MRLIWLPVRQSEIRRLGSPCRGFFSELKKLLLRHPKTFQGASQPFRQATAGNILGNVSDRVANRETKHARSRVNFTSRKMSRPKSAYICTFDVHTETFGLLKYPFILNQNIQVSEKL